MAREEESYQYHLSETYLYARVINKKKFIATYITFVITANTLPVQF